MFNYLKSVKAYIKTHQDTLHYNFLSVSTTWLYLAKSFCLIVYSLRLKQNDDRNSHFLMKCDFLWTCIFFYFIVLSLRCFIYAYSLCSYVLYTRIFPIHRITYTNFSIIRLETQYLHVPHTK